MTSVPPSFSTESLPQHHEVTPSSTTRVPLPSTTPVEEEVILNQSQRRLLDVIKSGQSWFCTGEAGVGKSVVIAALIRQERERGGMIGITATTGNAAVALGGMTIHSWAGVQIFQRPLEEVVKSFQKQKTHQGTAAHRITHTRLLVIDEISMLNGFQFNYLDFLCREIRGRLVVPFGGMQVMAFGDFAQLPPVENPPIPIRGGPLLSMLTGSAGVSSSSSASSSAGTSSSSTILQTFKSFRPQTSSSAAPAALRFEQRSSEDDRPPPLFGSHSWLQTFGTRVIVLKVQFRQTEPETAALIHRARHGKLTPDDIHTLSRRRVSRARLRAMVYARRKTHPGVLEPTYLDPNKAQVAAYNEERLQELSTPMGEAFGELVHCYRQFSSDRSAPFGSTASGSAPPAITPPTTATGSSTGTSSSSSHGGNEAGVIEETTVFTNGEWEEAALALLEYSDHVRSVGEMMMAKLPVEMHIRTRPGAQIMLLANVSRKLGLCNGTRGSLLRLGLPPPLPPRPSFIPPLESVPEPPPSSSSHSSLPSVDPVLTTTPIVGSSVPIPPIGASSMSPHAATTNAAPIEPTPHVGEKRRASDPMDAFDRKRRLLESTIVERIDPPNGSMNPLPSSLDPPSSLATTRAETSIEASGLALPVGTIPPPPPPPPPISYELPDVDDRVVEEWLAFRRAQRRLPVGPSERISAVTVHLENQAEPTVLLPYSWREPVFPEDAGKPFPLWRRWVELRQLPIALAWALTIHKTQGKSLSSAYLNLGPRNRTDAQAYVALSGSERWVPHGLKSLIPASLRRIPMSNSLMSGAGRNPFRPPRPSPSVPRSLRHRRRTGRESLPARHVDALLVEGAAVAEDIGLVARTPIEGNRTAGDFAAMEAVATRLDLTSLTSPLVFDDRYFLPRLVFLTPSSTVR